MKTRVGWFIVAGLCIAFAVAIFGGRTQLAAHLGDSWAYRGILLSAYIFLAGATGSFVKAFSITSDD